MEPRDVIQREKVVLGYFDKPNHSGYAVYRAYMGSEAYRDDPLISPFLNDKNGKTPSLTTCCRYQDYAGDCLHMWVGQDMHAIITTVQNGKQINIVLTHKDEADVSEGWSVPGKKSDVLKLIQNWDSAVIRVWEKMDKDKIIDWKLVFRLCLDKWVTDSGLVAIMGDAAHPFLPTSAQGASQAFEDGATIALCLAKAGKGNVPLALRSYFEIRHEYAKAAQKTGVDTRSRLHALHDESGNLKEGFDPNQDVLDSYYLWANDVEKVVEEKVACSK